MSSFFKVLFSRTGIKHLDKKENQPGNYLLWRQKSVADDISGVSL